MGQYSDSVEEQHAYIKETVDTVFPSSIRVLQVNGSGHTETRTRCWVSKVLKKQEVAELCCVVAAGRPGQDQAEDPEAGEGRPDPEGAVQGAVQDQLPHPCGVR